jgi:hypothetical protein
MALNPNEKMLLEAISSMLQQDARLGVPIHNETSHTSQFRWEGIDDAFALKAAESPFADSLTSAFFAVHSHKYIDNPTFKLSFEKEMSARAVPMEERLQALKYLDAMVNELSPSKPSEQDAGWNPNMDEIADMTSHADNRKPQTSKPFTGGGPAPEGDRGGKGGIYMEAFEDSVNVNTTSGIWKVTYKVTADQDQKISAVRAINEETSESINNVYEKLGINDDDLWSAIDKEIRE